MNAKAQAGLEYLITYGWAIVLIATVLSVLVIIISNPASSESGFVSSQNTKLMLKSSSVLGGNAKIALQNITGGNIKIVNFAATGLYDCTINGQAGVEITIGQGESILIECGTIEGEKGEISVEYEDPAGLLQTAAITSNKKTATSSNTITVCNTIISEAGSYVLADNIGPCVEGITINVNDVSLNCQNKTITGVEPPEEALIGIMISSAENVTVSNCNITKFMNAISLTGSTKSTLSNNNLTDSLGRGINVIGSNENNILNNTITGSGTAGMFLLQSSGNTLANNSVNGGLSRGIMMFTSNENQLNNNNFCNNPDEDILCAGSAGNAGTGNSIEEGGTFCTGIEAGPC